MVLGIIFAVILLLLGIVFAYLMVTKPFGVDVTNLPQAIMGSDKKTSTYDNPILNTQQEIFLETLGVNTQTITTITPAQQSCAVSKLGQPRVDAIVAGSALTTSDYLKAGSCFK